MAARRVGAWRCGAHGASSTRCSDGCSSPSASSWARADRRVDAGRIPRSPSRTKRRCSSTLVAAIPAAAPPGRARGHPLAEIYRTHQHDDAKAEAVIARLVRRYSRRARAQVCPPRLSSRWSFRCTMSRQIYRPRSRKIGRALAGRVRGALRDRGRRRRLDRRLADVLKALKREHPRFTSSGVRRDAGRPPPSPRASARPAGSSSSRSTPISRTIRPHSGPSRRARTERSGGGLRVPGGSAGLELEAAAEPYRNVVRNQLNRETIRDTGCSLKAFAPRRSRAADVQRDATASADACQDARGRVTEVPVHHRPRASEDEVRDVEPCIPRTGGCAGRALDAARGVALPSAGGAAVNHDEWVQQIDSSWTVS